MTHIKLGYDLIASIFKEANSAAELHKCGEKHYQKFTDHGKKLPNHNKHKSNIKKGKFP